MFERFTEPARQAVVNAQDAAKENRASKIGTEHLLVGILRSPDSMPAMLLEQAGVNEEALTPFLTPEEPQQVPDQSLPFTALAKETLEEALNVALARTDKYIGSEHLLYALLRIPDQRLQMILRDRFDVSPVELQEAMDRELAGASSSPQRPGVQEPPASPAPAPDDDLAAAVRELTETINASVTQLSGRLSAVERQLAQLVSRSD